MTNTTLSTDPTPKLWTARQLRKRVEYDEHLGLMNLESTVGWAAGVGVEYRMYPAKHISNGMKIKPRFFVLVTYGGPVRDTWPVYEFKAATWKQAHIDAMTFMTNATASDVGDNMDWTPGS